MIQSYPALLKSVLWSPNASSSPPSTTPASKQHFPMSCLSERKLHQKETLLDQFAYSECWRWKQRVGLGGLGGHTTTGRQPLLVSFWFLSLVLYCTFARAEVTQRKTNPLHFSLLWNREGRGRRSLFLGFLSDSWRPEVIRCEKETNELFS